MKLMIKAAAIGLGVLALGACNKHTDAGDNVVANADAVADNVEANAENTADAVRNEGEQKADSVRNSADADGNSSN